MLSYHSRLPKIVTILALILVGILVYTIPRKTSGPLSHETPNQASALPDVQGNFDNQSFHSNELKGRWHLLTFWAYWCLPCLTELPTLGLLDQTLDDKDLQIVAVNLDDPQSENFQNAKQFILDKNLKFRVYFDGDRKVSKAFDINELPQNFLINPKGQIVWKATGSIDWSSSVVVSELKKIIKSEPTPSGESR